MNHVPTGCRGFDRLTGLIVALAVLACAPAPARAQAAGDETLQQIEAAFENGDSRALLRSSAAQIEIAMFEASTLFSRGQAMYVLEAFFQQFPPRKCTLRQPVKTRESWFAGGQYWYGSTERPLRIYIGLRRSGDQWELREIRIDERQEE